MAVIEGLAFASAAGFAVIVVATVVVIIGVRQEQRLETFPPGRPPTALALLARRVTGAHAGLLAEQQPEQDCPEDGPPYERPPGCRDL